MGLSQCLQGQLVEPWQGGEQFYAVIDMVSAEHARFLAPAFRANGHLVCVQDRLEQPLCARFSRALSVHEVALGRTLGENTQYAFALTVFGDLLTGGRVLIEQWRR